MNENLPEPQNLKELLAFIDKPFITCQEFKVVLKVSRLKIVPEVDWSTLTYKKGKRQYPLTDSKGRRLIDYPY